VKRKSYKEYKAGQAAETVRIDEGAKQPKWNGSRSLWHNIAKIDDRHSTSPKLEKHCRKTM